MVVIIPNFQIPATILLPNVKMALIKKVQKKRIMLLLKEKKSEFIPPGKIWKFLPSSIMYF